MTIYQFKLPDIGEGVAEAEIAEMDIRVGDDIQEDDQLCVILTDKAAVEIPSPVSGKIVSINGQPGDMIAVGSVLVEIQTEASATDNTVSDTSQSSPGQSSPSQSSSHSKENNSPQELQNNAAKDNMPASDNFLDKPYQPQNNQHETPAKNHFSTKENHTDNKAPLKGLTKDNHQHNASFAKHKAQHGIKPMASPAVRKRARDLGIELNYIHGTGRDGHICHKDIDDYIERGSVGHSIYRQAKMGVEEIKLIGMRRKIASAMTHSKQTIPHFSYIEECDVSELEALRKKLNINASSQQRLTILAFLIQALIKVIPKFPQINANLDTENGILHRTEALHIGIATQTPQGLMVPVMHHAETMDLYQCASELRRLTQSAKSGTISREELIGSTITISSLGPMGGIVSTPIINAPNVAIIGVNKMIARPVVHHGVIVPRLMMNLSSSFDHRIVDGWDAAGFIQSIKSLIEYPATLFIE